MSFRKYCRWMSQHELLDQSILPKANGLFTHGKTFYRIKSQPLTATASRHDQVMTTRYFVPRCFDVH